MTKDAANSALAFVCGLCLLLLLEAGAAFLVLGGFDTEGALAETDLPAVTLLTDLRGTFTDLQGNEMSFADLRGKVVFITGGARGIGAAVGAESARRGASVALVNFFWGVGQAV